MPAVTQIDEDYARLVRALPENPYIDAGLRGFILNTARREYWRVCELCDLSDLVQDGVMLAWKCYQRYVLPRTDLTGSKGDRRWFQALVKTSFMNHISSLAAKHKGVSVRPAADFAALAEDGDAYDVLEQNAPPAPELGTLAALLAQAPRELLELVRLLAGDGKEALSFLRKGRAGRETTNEYYCRLLNVNPRERDLLKELREHFGNV